MKDRNKQERIEKINKQIENLSNILLNLQELDQENEKVKDKIKLIKEQIIDYKLEINNVNDYIPFKKRFINDFLKSKTVMLNLLLITFELLNIFTDIFKDSNNEHLRAIAIIVPLLTIYLRTFQK